MLDAVVVLGTWFFSNLISAHHLCLARCHVHVHVESPNVFCEANVRSRKHLATKASVKSEWFAGFRNVVTVVVYMQTSRNNLWQRPAQTEEHQEVVPLGSRSRLTRFKSLRVSYAVPNKTHSIGLDANSKPSLDHQLVNVPMLRLASSVSHERQQGVFISDFHGSHGTLPPCGLTSLAPRVVTHSFRRNLPCRVPCGQFNFFKVAPPLCGIARAMFDLGSLLV